MRFWKKKNSINTSAVSSIKIYGRYSSLQAAWYTSVARLSYRCGQGEPTSAANCSNMILRIQWRSWIDTRCAWKYVENRWQWKADSLAKKFQNVFGGYFLKYSGQHRYGEKWLFFFLLALSWPCGPTSQFVYFYQALINTAHQTRLTFDLEVETAHGYSSSCRTRSHGCRWKLWRVACVVLWSSVKSSQKSVFRPLGDDKEILSQFLHTSRQMCFWQNPDRHPPQLTGRRVSDVHQGGHGAPNELATFRVHDADVDFVKRSVCNTRKCAASDPRSAWEFLRPIGQDRREISIFPGILESFNK